MLPLQVEGDLLQHQAAMAQQPSQLPNVKLLTIYVPRIVSDRFKFLIHFNSTSHLHHPDTVHGYSEIFTQSS